MQATVLVHELYLRQLGNRSSDWQDRAHFYNFAAQMMRLILIDHARSAHSVRRGGGATHLPLSDELRWAQIGSPEVVDLSRALDALALIDAKKVTLLSFDTSLAAPRKIPQS
jgi:DNA-directed RNA polymerase specialized sigma24 family protein